MSLADGSPADGSPAHSIDLDRVQTLLDSLAFIPRQEQCLLAAMLLRECMSEVGSDVYDVHIGGNDAYVVAASAPFAEELKAAVKHMNARFLAATGEMAARRTIVNEDGSIEPWSPTPPTQREDRP
ncbi:MAG: hypothetical protein WBD40_01345 [Tepidisphaeraceae bacterium]